MRDSYPIIRDIPKKKHFPFDGTRNSQKHVNDHKLVENRRRLHGTDPLKDGFDPGEDPIRREHKDRKRPAGNIPI